GLDAAPPADPLFRRELSALAAREGRPALWERLNCVAPAIAARLHPNDAVRVIRALEIVRAGGGAFSEAGRWRHPSGPYDVTYFGLTLDRAALAQRLRRRAQAFAAAGLREEVRRLLVQGYSPALPSLQSIGYREFVALGQGRLTEDEALRRMQRDTVRYAKRRWQIEESLEELAGLVEAAGGSVVERVVQERKAPSPALYFGKGKIDEIGQAAHARDANLFVSDDRLSPSQERNISEALGIKV